MGALDPKFTESFDVGSGNYRAFIDKVRKRVMEHCSMCPGFVDEPVVLPQEVEGQPPKLWFHIDLRTKTRKSLTLAIRMDNLYLVGFKPSVGDFANRWFEFNNNEMTHLIISEETRWLGFTGSYTDLVGGDVEGVELGRCQMVYAVEELAKYKPKTSEMTLEDQEQEEGEEDPYGEPKSMLANLVIMLCEGMRFHKVSDRVEEAFKKHGKVAHLDSIEHTYVNDWGDISEAVLKNDFQYVKDTGITNREEAAEIIALLKNKSKKKL